MANTEIPKALIEQIKEGNAVLFLGSGAIYDCIHPNEKKPPLGNGLARLIADKYLGQEYMNYDLQHVSELAINETSLGEVQKFIHDIFVEFLPAQYHLQIPTYKWHSIFTTNYDLVIERAYDQVNEKLQNIVTFIKDSEIINDRMKQANSMMYVKLHGSISDIYDNNIPLILTPDQYIDHKINRKRLFSRLEEASREHPIIFVGFSFADHDIRQTLRFLDQNIDTKPRSYMVGPNISDAEERLWDRKKITSIKLPFEKFMQELGKLISPNERILSSMVDNSKPHPIISKFAKNIDQLSTLLSEFLSRDVDYVHKNLAAKNTNPQDFYKGYFENWDPIIKEFDVPRELTERILSEIFLIEEEERLTKQEFYLIKGNAGSGKTILMHRIAWNASIDFNKLCLVYKSDTSIEYNRISEIYHLAKERIFLFVDNVTEKADDIEYITKKAIKDDVLITVIGVERTNIWNIQGDVLNTILSREYEMKYLNDGEIDNLLVLLEKYKSLGYLSNKTREEKKAALAEKSNRELLVALHEATAGKPFEDIMVDEYNSIPDEEAKSLYVSICTFHRIGTYARAGIISRLHNINFEYFKDKLFKPLESIVYHHRNYVINDYVYTTRHQYIAELVFEHVLVNQEERFQKYLSIISKLDFGYESDRQLFISLTKAKLLIDTFKDPEYIRQIYDVAYENLGDDASLLQQEAIFEMSISGGNFTKAEELLNIATEVDPFNPNIIHSKAEFLLKKAEKAYQPLIINKLLTSAKELCNKIIKNKRNANVSRGYHTMLKVLLFELNMYIADQNVALLNPKIQEFEKLLNEALQMYPKESFLLDAEANFNDLFDKQPDALSALESAFNENKRSPYLATRLANYYYKIGRTEDALAVLRSAIDLNINHKDLNFLHAKLLMHKEPENYIDLKHYLRKSFTKFDKRYEAHFWYARLLYILHEQESVEYFNYLKGVPLDSRIKRSVQGIITVNKKEKLFEGTIIKLESSYGFVKEDKTSESIYFIRESEDDGLRRSLRVKFKKGFNYNGPIVII